MGHGSWSRDKYTTTTLRSLETGKNHDYSKKMMRSQPRSSWTVHETLDPKRENRDGDHAGTIIRESLDFDEHPNTTPVVIVLDVTGSMAYIPAIIQGKLPDLMQTLIDAGVPDPQVLICAVGDAYSDAVPVQIGQFESDNRIDEQIDKIVLEGGGGGGNHESYDLVAYFLANYTHLDSFELRGKKGFCFFIGDERLYDEVNPEQVEKHIGVDLPQAHDTADVFADLKEKYEVFFLYSNHSGSGGAHVIDNSKARQEGHGRAGAIGWDLVVDKEQILILDDADQVCETVSKIVAVREGDRVEA